MTHADPRRYVPGQILLRRWFYGDDLAWLTVDHVVRDDARGLVLWRVPGSPHLWRGTPDGRTARDMSFPEWVHAPKVLHRKAWTGRSVLTLIPHGAAHSVWWWFTDGAFTGWYVNLEEPHVRWEHGVDSTDQDLDVVVAPDRTWTWKDEHEMLERLRHPERYWVRDPDAVRAEGERVIAAIEARAFPFDGTWCDFRPDPTWAVPSELPSGWDRPRARPAGWDRPRAGR